MTYVCSECGNKAAANYVVNSELTIVTHIGGKSNCPGIGKPAIRVQNVSDKKVKEMKASKNQAKSAAHGTAKSIKAIESYQTPHKNTKVQETRVKLAVTGGLGGHASATSNAKQNNHTTGGLAKINKATK